MLAVALVTSPIAAFASSLSSTDPVTGMLVALLPPVHSLQPVQTRWNQVSTHIPPFAIYHHQYHTLSTLSLPYYTFLLPYHTDSHLFSGMS